MSLIDKVKANIKSVPKPIYVLAAIVPFGFCALGVYVLVRPEPKMRASLREEVDKIIGEKDEL